MPYVWDKFIEQQTGRISGKVKQRLQGLVLLAVQVMANEINGTPSDYIYGDLAHMVGISQSTWHKNYQDRWLEVKNTIIKVDLFSLKNTLY